MEGYRMRFEETLIIALVTASASGLLGFFLGRIKEFRESKQKIYSLILPNIIEKCFNPDGCKEEKYNSALILSWIYSNKKVAKQINKIESIIVKPERGDISKEAQDLLDKIRKDIQPFPWQRLKVSEFEHIYTRFSQSNLNKY
jgi:hypothetical protein